MSVAMFFNESSTIFDFNVSEPMPYASFQDNPAQPLKGVLPNGEGFRWGLLNEYAIPDMLQLQEAVADAADDHQKKFLIARTHGDFGQSMIGHDHLYWGAWVGDKLVAFFGIAEKDEEISDGRGKTVAPEKLGVERHDEVDILKAAQVHPDYRGEKLASLAAAVRYQYFLNDDKKRVIMTKMHEDNFKVIANYTNNHFVEADRSSETDRGETFDVVTLMASRSTIQNFMETKGPKIVQDFSLSPDLPTPKVRKQPNPIMP